MIDENSARSRLEKHHDNLHSIVQGAWKTWKLFSPQIYGRPLINTDRQNVFNLMIQEAQGVFGGREREGIRVWMEYGTLMLSFENELILRFKKLDDNLQASNIPTQRQLEIDEQMPLPGVPESTFLDVGYVPDKLEENIQVYIVCSLRGKAVWQYNLEEPASELIPFEGATPSKPEIGKPVEVVAKPGLKKDRKRKNATE